MKNEYNIKIDLKNWILDIHNSRIFLSFKNRPSWNFHLAFINLVFQEAKKSKTTLIPLRNIDKNAGILCKTINPKLTKLTNLYTVWKQRLKIDSESRPYKIFLKENPCVEIFQRVSSHDLIGAPFNIHEEIEKQLTGVQKYVLNKILNADTLARNEKLPEQFQDDLSEYAINSCESLINIAKRDQKHALTEFLSEIHQQLFSKESIFINNLFSTAPDCSTLNPVFQIGINPANIETDNLKPFPKGLTEDSQSIISTQIQQPDISAVQKNEKPQKESVKESNPLAEHLLVSHLERYNTASALNEARIFRDGGIGPMWIDFATPGPIERRSDILETLLKEKFNGPEKKITILSGDTAAGKTTIIRHYGYDLITKNNIDENLVLYFNPRSNTPLPSFNGIKKAIRKTNETYYIIIDDAHLSDKPLDRLINQVLSALHSLNIKVLIGMRPYYKKDNYRKLFTYFNDERIRIDIKPDQEKTIPNLIDFVVESQKTQYKTKEEIEQALTETMDGWKHDMLNLAIGLQVMLEKGILDRSELYNWLRRRITTDYLGEKAIEGAEDVMLFMSAIYQDEIEVHKDWLREYVSDEIINKLINIGELIQLPDGMLTMHHSSLAELYFQILKNDEAWIHKFIKYLKVENWHNNILAAYIKYKLKYFPEKGIKNLIYLDLLYGYSNLMIICKEELLEILIHRKFSGVYDVLKFIFTYKRSKENIDSENLKEIYRIEKIVLSNILNRNIKIIIEDKSIDDFCVFLRNICDNKIRKICVSNLEYKKFLCLAVFQPAIEYYANRPNTASIAVLCDLVYLFGRFHKKRIMEIIASIGENRLKEILRNEKDIDLILMFIFHIKEVFNDKNTYLKYLSVLKLSEYSNMIFSLNNHPQSIGMELQLIKEIDEDYYFNLLNHRSHNIFKSNGLNLNDDWVNYYGDKLMALLSAKMYPKAYSTYKNSLELMNKMIEDFKKNNKK